VPGVVHTDVPIENMYMWRGTVVGALATRYINGECRLESEGGVNLDKELERIPGAKVRWEALLEYLKGLDAAHVVSEAAYALNVHTGEPRALGVDIGRNYPLDENSFFGSVDILITHRDGSVEVQDIKCSSKIRPEHTAQVKALMVLSGATRGSIVQVTEAGAMLVPLAEVTKEVLAATKTWMLELLRRRDARTIEKNPGKHCENCIHRSLCEHYGT
jgi:CRISPR/Cas system-associated exonuclease Cas4 (RecB family)